MIRRSLGTLLMAALVGVSTQSANAVVTNWTIQSSSSTLGLSGALSSGGTFLASLQGQSGATGGLSTSFTGNINTQQTIGGLGGISPTDIQFLSALLDANVSGDWDPVPGGTTGTAPADYGGRVDLGFLGGANLAVRDLTAGLSSGVLGLVGGYTSPGAQTFAGNIDVSLLTATADYRGFGIVGGQLGGGTLTDGIAGQSGSVLTAGTISYGPGGYAGTATLTIPVDFTFAAIVAGADNTDPLDDIGVYIRLLGAINATAATSAVPEANSLVLLGLVGSAIGFAGYRRKSKVVA